MLSTYLLQGLQSREERLSQISMNSAAQTGRTSREGCETAGHAVSRDLGGLLGGGEDMWVLEEESVG